MEMYDQWVIDIPRRLLIDRQIKETGEDKLFLAVDDPSKAVPPELPPEQLIHLFDQTTHQHIDYSHN